MIARGAPARAAFGRALVSVAPALGHSRDPVPTMPIGRDQKNRQSTPHVFGIRVGQPLVIAFSDPMLHDIHAMPRITQEFDLGRGR